uniref:transglycosylase domain-containing protein n=1 Tax=Vaginimicrobium propionicum TaxID=1871034 RepID=UPI0009714251|nr:transglycosylase domain-containing protein [Vaginimicrobium propionicum]
MSSSGETKLSRSIMFVSISLLIGVLVAGLAVPITALVAGLTKTASASLKQMPADLTVPPQLEGSTVLLSDGSVLTNFFDQDRKYVPLDQISKTMQDAQIAIEDHRFFEHGALDFKSVVRAALGNAASGGVSGGGSTLTQQYIKLVRQQLCNNEPTCVAEVTAPKLDRKVLEMRYAVALEQKLTKHEILERYLNIAYYGDGAYGVQSAAQHYFGVNAADLDLAQSALLAGLVQNPSNSDPVNNPDAALARRHDVLNAMVTYQNLDQAEADAANQVEFDPSKVSSRVNGCVGTRYPFVCQFAQNVLLSDQMPGLGSNPTEREETLKRAGLTITLTVDPRIQDAAQSAVSSVVGPQDAPIAVADTVEPSTGRIIAMAQSRSVMGTDKAAGETFYNYSVSHDMGGNEGFTMGSTFKTFAAAAAIQQGHYPDTTWYDVQRTQSWNGRSFKDCEDKTIVLNDNPPWTTTNAVYSHSSGRFNMVDGMMWSVNNYWVNVTLDNGPCRTADMAERAGVQLAWPRDLGGYGEHLRDYGRLPAFVLGSADVTVLSMATAYGTFGNRGIRCLPIILDKVTNKDGSEVPVPSADCQQTIDAKVADGVNYVLKAVQTRGLSANAYIPNGIDQASKTGTADDSKSAVAFVGYTPYYSTAVAIAGDTANDKWLATPEAQRNVAAEYLTPLNGPLGWRDAGIIWKPLMQAALEGKEPATFEPWSPPGPVVPTWNNSTIDTRKPSATPRPDGSSTPQSNR